VKLKNFGIWGFHKNCTLKAIGVFRKKCFSKEWRFENDAKDNRAIERITNYQSLALCVYQQTEEWGEEELGGFNTVLLHAVHVWEWRYILLYKWYYIHCHSWKLGEKIDTSYTFTFLERHERRIREKREGWPLLTVETVVKRDSKSTNERVSSLVGSLGL
jgi:hypothetical protein